jgi:predicted AlkP superfamily pyrophosphatase or phosphodiesterase
MIKFYIVIDIVGLELGHLESELVPNISSLATEGESAMMEPVFPGVTCTVQASILSGTYPNQHGIICNGFYDRINRNVSFWEQSSDLVQTDRIWDMAHKKMSGDNDNNKTETKIKSTSISETKSKTKTNNVISNSSSSLPSHSYNLKTAVLFWQNTMFSNANIIVTPRPIHLDNGVVMWCYSKPVDYYDQQLKPKIGEFNLATYWGPLASSASSKWISEATTYTLEKYKPNFLLTYIPHIDYSAQKFGKNSSQVRDDLKVADGIVENIVHKTVELGIREESQFIIISEYGFNDVSGAVPLNLRLRDAGLVATRTIQDQEYIDYENSDAFAMADHQIAHIYVKEGFVGQTKKVLEQITGVESVLDDQEKRHLKIDHERSGELLAVADRDKWFSYHWWYEKERAPPFAGNVDIHRKPGYDPLELFIEPNTRSISQNTGLVKGSHGRKADYLRQEGLSLYLSSRKTRILNDIDSPPLIKCVDLGKYLTSLV